MKSLRLHLTNENINDLQMKKLILLAFIFLFGLYQAQTKSKSSTTKKKTEKEWINPVKLTKEERNRPYMNEVLKTRDSLTPKEAERRRKNIAIGNPFEKYGVYPKIATLSKGKYLEFHDKDSIVVIGSIKYNTKQKRIVELLEIDLSEPDAQPIGDTRGRWISPDPLSEQYTSWSPYHYVYNNPISNIDPDGREILTDFKLLQNGKIERVDPNDGSEKNLNDKLFATDKNGNVVDSKVFQIDKANASDNTTISKLETQNDKGSQVVTSDSKDLKSNVGLFQFASENSGVEWSLGIGDNFSNAIGTSNQLLGAPNMSSYLDNMYLDIHSHRFTTGPSSKHTRIAPDGTSYDTGDQAASHNATTRRYIYYVGATVQAGTLYQFGKGINKKEGNKIGNYGDYKDRKKLYERIIRTAK